MYIRNANWLAAEMNGVNTVRTNCASFCGNNTIAGNPQVCSQQTFTVPFGAGAVYNWSVSTAGLVTITPNGNSVLVVRNGLADGTATLSVNISGACGNTTLTLPLIIGRGASSVNFLTLNPVCEYTGRWTAYFYGTCTEVPGATNYEWFTKDLTNSNNPYISKATGTSVDFPLRPGNRNYAIRIVATTPCGTLTNEQVVFAPNCTGAGGRIAVMPNPVTDVLTIQYVEEGDAPANTENEISEVIVTDKIGNILIRKNFTKGSKSVSVPVNTLGADVYFVKTFNGKTWISTQFVKK